jgi:hypothetical protein
MGQQRRRQEEQNSPLSAALKKQNAFVASSFFPSITIYNPQRRPPRRSKKEKYGFLRYSQEGLFFCSRQPGIGHVLCRKKSMPHVET